MELVGDDDAKPMLQPGFPPPQSHPWLLLCQNKQGTLYSITQQRYYKIDCSFMYNKYERAHTCKDGWMVLHDCDNFDILLFNVYSRERVQLPNLKLNTHFAYLSSNPHDPSCYVILTKKITDFDLIINFCKIGEQAFVTQRLCDDTLLTSFTSFGGNLYGLRKYSTTLVRIEFNDQSAQFQEVIGGNLFDESSSRPKWSGSYTNGYITESCGEILLVVKIYFAKMYCQVENIRVYRADLCKRRWVEMKTIGKRTIFLGSVGGIFCINNNNANVRNNCIYFIEEDDRNMYIFYLDDRSVSINLPCPHVGKKNIISRWIL
nr:F-box/kelch-repeat protein At1g57790-like [Ipomoea batatas]